MQPTVTDRAVWSVCLSVSQCQSVTIVSSAKAAELMEMPCTRMGPRNHLLDGDAQRRHLVSTTEPSTCSGDGLMSNYFDH